MRAKCHKVEGTLLRSEREGATIVADVVSFIRCSNGAIPTCNLYKRYSSSGNDSSQILDA